jgi:uncharacterized membrane protein
MAPPISHSSGGNLPWFIRRPSRIVAAIIAAAIAYLATSRLPDELNLLIPYDVALAVYFALFGVFMQWASPEDAAEIARRACVSPTLPTGRRLPTSFTAPRNKTG